MKAYNAIWELRVGISPFPSVDCLYRVTVNSHNIKY